MLVVATTDTDTVACMQELASVHHTATCLTNGQYDNDSVQRVYVLLHDTHSTVSSDPKREYDKVILFYLLNFVSLFLSLSQSICL